MLPRHPVMLGGILAPVLWTGILHSFMGIINPTLADHIAWGWFLVSQVVYGVTAGIVVARQERVPTGQSLPFFARMGFEAPGMMESRPDAGPPQDASRNKDKEKPDAPRCFGASGLRGRAARRLRACAGRSAQSDSAAHCGDRFRNALQRELRRVPRSERTERSGDRSGQSRVPGAGGRRHVAQVDFRRHAGHGDAGICAIGGRHVDRCAGECADCRHAQTVVAAQCLCGATPPPYAQTQAGDAHRGELAYQARCASCHEPSHGSRSPARSISSLVADQALRSIIIAGRPDIGQPDWRHDGPGGKAATPLSAQEVDDIVTYLASLRNAAQQDATSAAPGQTASAAAKGR